MNAAFNSPFRKRCREVSKVGHRRFLCRSMQTNMLRGGYLESVWASCSSLLLNRASDINFECWVKVYDEVRHLKSNGRDGREPVELRK